MADFEALEKQGWYLSATGIEECSQNGNKSTQAVTKAALDLDLKHIGKTFLPDGLNRAKQDVLEGPCVLQVQKVRNVSAPKDNEESGVAPPLLRLTLTDGSSTCSALCIESIDRLGLDTPPGTKIKLMGKIPMSHGFLLLARDSVRFLGGHVEKLVENWQLKRELAKHSRFAESGAGGPPPFVPFGQKYRMKEEQQQPARGRKDNFKSLDTKAEKKEDGEFEEQRRATIAEVMKDKGDVHKKTFGAGSLVKPQDKDVAHIVSMGFSAEEATNALKHNSSNVEQAIDSLLNRPYENKPYENRGRGSRSQSFHDRPMRGGDRGDRPEQGERPERGRGRRRHDQDGEDYEGSSRPSAPASLFDFLKSKIPAKEETASSRKDTSNNYSSTNNRSSDVKDRQLPPRLSKQSTDQGRPPPNYNDKQRSHVNNAPPQFVHRQPQKSQQRYDSNDQRKKDFNQDKGQGRYSDQGSRSKDDTRSTRQNSDGKYGRNRDSYGDHADKPNVFQGQGPQKERLSGSNNDRQRGDSRSYGGRGDESYSGRREGGYAGKNDQTNSYQNNRSSKYNDGQNRTYQQNNRSNQSDSYHQQSSSYRSNQNQTSSKSEQQQNKNYSNEQYYRNNQSQQGNRDKTQNPDVKSKQESRKSNNPKSAQVSVADVQKKMAEVSLDAPQIVESHSSTTYMSRSVASRSAKHHNQHHTQQQQMDRSSYPRQWREGDVCLAKYWEDEQYYHAQIHAIAQSGQTCVVTFSDYGNSEEVLMSDIRPLPATAWSEPVTSTTMMSSPMTTMMGPPAPMHMTTAMMSPHMYAANQQPYMPMTSEPMTGGLDNMEFRRGGGGRSYTARPPPGKPTQQYYVPPSHR